MAAIYGCKESDDSNPDDSGLGDSEPGDSDPSLDDMFSEVGGGDTPFDDKCKEDAITGLGAEALGVPYYVYGGMDERQLCIDA
ncbi:hypothetical protein BC629DRAFT_339208 [Irpex lacteus]|nr:hypothetical protein BC629DRAFT_339208 [Irpex lacteus]